MCIRSLITHGLIFILLFYFVVFTGKSGKTHRENHFHYLRVRSASLTDVRVRISNKNNGGLNISKRENSKLWRAVFPNCAPVSLGEQRILVKQVFIYWFM